MRQSHPREQVVQFAGQGADRPVEALLVQVAGKQRHQQPPATRPGRGKLAGFDDQAARHGRILITQILLNRCRQVTFEKQGIVRASIARCRQDFSVFLHAYQRGQPIFERCAESLLIALMNVGFHAATHGVADGVDVQGTGYRPWLCSDRYLRGRR
ncbi:hypothetical protein D3C72_1158160 [compost metagenome]